MDYIKEIADAEESARSDAEDYTDGQLKSYYTKSEVETSIKNTKNSILLSAKETAEQYVDGKLKNYSTSAQIKVKTDSLFYSPINPICIMFGFNFISVNRS